uniref:Uncharacterized protein n=1 Tax=Anopheles dirus TaxID=7168 RepID=A0A182N836_9DIPT
MTAPGAPPCLGLGSTVDLGRCSRRPCGRGGSTPHGLLYPEFQHRPPPPSYQASMQEYRLRLLLLDRDRQSGRMRSTASPPPTYRSNVGSLLRIPLSSRYNNGSSNSIFGGISGIISGAVGGGSSNSVNNVPQASHADLQVNTHPYGAEGGHHGTLPPSYRSVNLQPTTTPPPPLPPPVIETLAPQPSSPSPGDANLISEDNVHPAGPQTGNKPSATGANQHHPASPSIIKIDDRRRRSSCADERNSIPNVSLIDTGANEEPPSGGGDASSSSSSRLCNGVAAVGAAAATTPAAIPTANGGSKDLVTIVTISGTIEPSAMGASRSVYTSSSSSSSNTSPGTGGGATCTLLNSNSTPLLATVIPVSKAATQTAGTGPL